jgi:hypothetical protein
MSDGVLRLEDRCSTRIVTIRVVSVPANWIRIGDLSEASDLEMPSLANLDTDDGNLGSLIKVVFEHDTLPREVLARNVTYVRLVSRAIRSYERARIALEAGIDARTADLKGSLGASWRATDEFETLFNSVHRAMRILWTLKVMRESPIKKSLLAHPGVFDIVNKLRDASEHIEDRLISRHRPHAFIAYDKGFEYADLQIEYDQVSGWLEHLYLLCGTINTVRT